LPACNCLGSQLHHRIGITGNAFGVESGLRQLALSPPEISFTGHKTIAQNQRRHKPGLVSFAEGFTSALQHLTDHIRVHDQHLQATNAKRKWGYIAVGLMQRCQIADRVAAEIGHRPNDRPARFSSGQRTGDLLQRTGDLYNGIVWTDHSGLLLIYVPSGRFYLLY